MYFSHSKYVGTDLQRVRYRNSKNIFEKNEKKNNKNEQICLWQKHKHYKLKMHGL